MKGIQGLIVAIGLGILGLMLNWFYLSNRSKHTEKVDFVGIRDGETVYWGERLTKDVLVKVPIPMAWVKDLDEFAVPYEAAGSVIGERVWRTLKGPRLLLDDDRKTPAPELNLGDNERAWGVSIDTRRFALSHIVPGDLVSFMEAAPRVAYGTSASDDSSDGEGPGAIRSPESPKPVDAPDSSGTIGPFEVLALGNRLGSAEVMQAAGIRQVREDVMLIKVKVNPDGSYQPPAPKLLKLLKKPNFRPLGIELYPRKR